MNKTEEESLKSTMSIIYLVTFGIFGRINWQQNILNLLPETGENGEVSYSATHLTISIDSFYVLPLLNIIKNKWWHLKICLCTISLTGCMWARWRPELISLAHFPFFWMLTRGNKTVPTPQLYCYNQQWSHVQLCQRCVGGRLLMPSLFSPLTIKSSVKL